MKFNGCPDPEKAFLPAPSNNINGAFVVLFVPHVDGNLRNHQDSKAFLVPSIRTLWDNSLSAYLSSKTSEKPVTAS